MSQQDIPNQAELAAGFLSEAPGELAIREQPVAVQDAAGDYAAAVKDILASEQQLAADLASLHEKRDLIPVQGANRLRAEAIAEATSRADAADRRAERAGEALEGALVDAALPVIDRGRESLARDEARIALGGAEGDSLVARALRVVTNGSDEARAVIFSPFFRTMMAARGVSDPDAAIAQLKTVAAATAVERGTTGKEILAGKALQGAGFKALEGARISAMLAVRRTAGQ